MPQVVNGIGTWYYGKKNKVVRQAVCSQCGNKATLTSYDTRLFFVVIFIPIIPLQKKRIIEDCSACRQHRLMPLKQYNDLRDGVLGDALKQFHRNPTEPDHAKMVLTAYASLFDWQGLQEFTPKILKYHDEDSEVLLTLGVVQRRLSMDQEAEETFGKILSLDADNKMAKEELAGIHIEARKPAEAHRLIQHIIDGRESDKWWMLMALCSVYQAEGYHKEALELLDAVEAMVPNVAEDKAFKKMRAASSRNFEKATPLGVGAYKNLHEIGKPDHTKRNLIRFAFGLVAVLILIAGVYTGAAIYMGKNQTVYIVNGLNNPYLVTVNGDGPYRVGSLQASEVTVAQGEINVEVISEDYAIDPFTVNISNTLLSRPFNGDVFVINPDGTAILEKQDIVYSDGSVDEEDITYDPTEYFAGENLYTIAEVDYSFEESSKQIRLSSGRNYEVRTQLGVFRGYEFIGSDGANRESRLYMLPEVLDDENVMRIALKAYEYDGEFATISWLLRSIMKLDEYRQLLEKEVEKRPIDLRVHQIYQSLLLENEGWKEALAVYRALATEVGDNPETSYLLAQVTPDTDEAIDLYKNGLASEGIAWECHNALAGIYLSNGDFALAHEHASQFDSHDGEDNIQSDYYFHTSVATGDVSNFLPKDPDSSREIHWSVTHSRHDIVMVAMDQGKEVALGYLEESVAKQRGVSTEEEVEAFRRDVLLMIELLTGEIDTAYQMAQAMLRENHFNVYYAALMQGDVDAVMSIYADEGSYAEVSEGEEEYDPFEWMDVEDAMLLATLARRSGNDEIEKKCLAAALNNLQESESVPAIHVAEIIESDLTETPEFFLKSALHFVDKKALLLYLGEREPENRDRYWDMVRKLNFDGYEYRLAYAKLMGDW